MTRTFCEAMREDPVYTMMMLDDLGYVGSGSQYQKIQARLQEAYEQGGVEAAEELAHRLGVTIDYE